MYNYNTINNEPNTNKHDRNTPAPSHTTENLLRILGVWRELSKVTLYQVTANTIKHIYKRKKCNGVTLHMGCVYFPVLQINFLRIV